MFLADKPSYSINRFGGAQDWDDPDTQSPSVARIARNVEFLSTEVQTRRGFASAIDVGVAQQAMFIWKQGLFGSAITWMAYAHSSTTVSIRAIPAGSVFNLITGLTGLSTTIFAPWGKRLFIVPRQAVEWGVYQAYVWDGDTANAARKAFQRPLLTTELTIGITTPAAGLVTAGLHKFGAVIFTKDGYTTKPSPTDANLVLQPGSITTAGNTNVRVTLTPASTWPTWVDSVQVVMTTVDNEFEYFLVAGTKTNAFPGFSTPVVIDINQTDIQIRSTGTEAADYFNLLSQDGSGNGPFNCKYVGIWGNRVYWIANYGGVDVIFISEPENPQWITATEHLKQLPDGLPIVGAQPLGKSLYVWGDGYTYALSDDGGKPVTFSPFIHCGSIGSPSPFGVATNKEKGYLIVASPQGLYLGEGTRFNDIPLSLRQPTAWGNIDWTFPQEVQVLDWPAERTFLVRYRHKDGSRKWMSWNYTRSRQMNPYKLDFSEGFQSVTNHTIGQMQVVQNPSNNLYELWFAAAQVSGGIARVTRQKSVAAGDADIYNDLSSGINFLYRTGFGPKDSMAPKAFSAARVGTRGAGTLSTNFISKDEVRTIAGRDITLSAAPGRHYVIGTNMQSEEMAVEFHNNSIANSWVNLHDMEVFSDEMLAFGTM